jgi:hypothetical protein
MEYNYSNKNILDLIEYLKERYSKYSINQKDNKGSDFDKLKIYIKDRIEFYDGYIIYPISNNELQISLLLSYLGNDGIEEEFEEDYIYIYLYKE